MPEHVDEKSNMRHISYASVIGSIMYAMTCTRSDVSYALSRVSRYQSNPGQSHWTAIKNILKYLRKTKDMFLLYGGVKNSELRGILMLLSAQMMMTVVPKQDGYFF